MANDGICCNKVGRCVCMASSFHCCRLCTHPAEVNVMLSFSISWADSIIPLMPHLFFMHRREHQFKKATFTCRWRRDEQMCVLEVSRNTLEENLWSDLSSGAESVIPKLIDNLLLSVGNQMASMNSGTELDPAGLCLSSRTLAEGMAKVRYFSTAWKIYVFLIRVMLMHDAII